MDYSKLIKITFIAQKNKPRFSEPCNNCGWCCLTEVCSIGVDLSGSRDLPCKFMRTEGDRHFCSLNSVDHLAKELAHGVGCDAKTTDEIIDSLK